MHAGADFVPLPPYTDPRSALRLTLPVLSPAERISVTESAERYMRVSTASQWQEFRREVTPYMVEPTDMIASRDFRGLVFVGPAQSGKTQMLQCAIAYTVMSDPGRVALFQMTRDAAALMEREKIAPMIRNSPALRGRMGTGRGADTQYQKLFTGGTHLTIDWPTIEKLSSTTVRLVLGTDFDRWGASIDGEGDPYTLMRARTRTYMSRGMVVVESSPGAPIRDESWRPQSPHDSPPVEYGVLSLYPGGTRARWYWTCPCCGQEFEPRFDRLTYPDSADPGEAGAMAEMRCPHEGCRQTFGHELKAELNAEGRWLHESQPDEDGRVRLVPVDHPQLRQTDLLSYWLDGAAAAFASWADLVRDYLVADAHFKVTGDEEKLKATVNTGQAQPFLPRAASAEMDIGLQALKDKAQGIDTPKGTAPAWARYVTVSVDVQGTRFAVGVTAWGVGGRHQPIDRFDLIAPPPGAPGAADRSLRPFEIAEDWAVLAPLSTQVWPVDGSDWGLRAVAIAVDMHGGGATTEHAYRFWRGRRKAGEARRWYLTRGNGGLRHEDRVWLKAPERVSGKAGARRRVASDIRILNMATDRLKDACAASLRLTDDGQNLCVIPQWMEHAHLVEFTAERRGRAGWEKRPGMVRNESLDHLVQARALHILLGGEKIDWSAPAKSWAVLSDDNEFAVRRGDRDAAAPAPADVPPARSSAPAAQPSRAVRQGRGEWRSLWGGR